MRTIMRSILSLALCSLLTAQSGEAQTQVTGPVSDSKPIEIKRGTKLSLVLAEEVSSGTAKKGQTVRLELSEDWEVLGRVILPKGTPALGTVNHLVRTIPGKRDGYVDVKPISIQLASGRRLRLSKDLPGEDDCGDMGPCWAFATVAFAVFLPLTLPALLVAGTHRHDNRQEGKDRILPVGDKVVTYTARASVLPMRALESLEVTK